MTIKELFHKYDGLCKTEEIYKFTDKTHKKHTDFIKYVDYVPTKTEVCSYDLVDEEEYNNTICANCEPCDFNLVYGDKNAKILVIYLNENYDI